MLIPVLDWDVCESCTPCQAKSVCKTRAIVQIDVGEPPYIELSRCSNCAACILACCCGAIRMENNGSVGGILNV
jgi:MinD superfamily P-loop ATPase